MKWFKRKIYNWVSEIDNDKRSKQMHAVELARIEPTSCDKDPILNFRVFSAIGGKVVEFTCYDQKTDRRSVTTYIINDDEDFGESIKKISTMEMLK